MPAPARRRVDAEETARTVDRRRRRAWWTVLLITLAMVLPLAQPTSAQTNWRKGRGATSASAGTSASTSVGGMLTAPAASDSGEPATASNSSAPGSTNASAPGSTSASAPGSASVDLAAERPAPTIPKTAAEEAEGATIRKIEIDGNSRVGSDRIIDYLKEHEGNAFSPTLLARDVRELWSSGLFDDIEVDLSRNDDGTIDLRFRVRERPNIKAVIFEGNKAFEADKLREEIEIKENTVLSVPAVRRSVQKIKDKYAEKGYFLSTVTSEIVPAKDNEATVKFVVSEGQEVTIKKINFVGNYHVSDDELKSVMLSAQGGFLGFGSGAAYRKDVFERDVLILQALYSDKGYLTISVGTPRVMLTPDREGIEVTINIEEGPQFTVKKLDVYEVDAEGKEVEPIGGRKKLRSLVSLAVGETFNRASLVKDLGAVKTLYKDAGYAHVEAEPVTQLDFDKREVSIKVPIKRGTLVHLGRIEVHGNTKTSDKVIRRELTIVEGQLYSETGLEDSRKRVLALGYFERVDFSTDRGATPDVMDVTFDIAEKATGTFQIGAGFSSIESFIATAQVQQANLFGRGQSLSLQAQVSGLRQLVNVRFFEPYFFGSDWSTSVDLYDQLRIYDSFQQQSLGGALTFGYPLMAPWLRANLTYTGESVKVTTGSGGTLLGTSAAVSYFQRLPLANLFQDGFLSSLRAGLVWDTRDNRLFPKNGVFLQASSELASPIFLSENNFLRHRATARFYYELADGFVLKSNSEFGFVSSPNPQGVPIFARFFLGGIFDMRGYRLRSVGPRLPLNSNLDPNTTLIANGANIGGNMQFYNNFELEFPILDKVGIRGVLFFDVGNAWNTEGQYCKAARGSPLASVVDPCNANLLNLRTSYGFGVRWFSPLGPLRFEWGFPINPLPYEDNNVFEFTIGNFF
jgi:outer membrane protein insertion porin family